MLDLLSRELFNQVRLFLSFRSLIDFKSLLFHEFVGRLANKLVDLTHFSSDAQFTRRFFLSPIRQFEPPIGGLIRQQVVFEQDNISYKISLAILFVVHDGKLDLVPQIRRINRQFLVPDGRLSSLLTSGGFQTQVLARDPDVGIHLAERLRVVRQIC